MGPLTGVLESIDSGTELATEDVEGGEVEHINGVRPGFLELQLVGR